MPWARLDDGFIDNPKFAILSDAAFRLWVYGIGYCQKHLTDGFIPEDEIQYFRLKAKNRGPLIAELLAPQAAIGKGPFWHRVDGGYQVHDYLHWNDESGVVKRARELSRERMQRFRGRVTNGATRHATNAVGYAVTDGATSDERTPLVRSSTYHVPRTDEKQEPASAEFRPVEAVENRTLLFQRRQRSRETCSGKPAHRVLTAVARGVLTDHPTVVDEGELLELVKVSCARSNLLYDSQSAARAVEAARAQLRRRKDIPA